MLAQTTHATLLARLGEKDDPVAWHEFCTRYGALIRNCARHQGLQPADCDDVLQDVLLALTKAMRPAGGEDAPARKGFEYDPARGKFRSYLKTVTLHAIFARSRQKRGEVALEDMRTDFAPASPGTSHAAGQATAEAELEQQWDAQWRQYHLNQAMRIVQSEFNETDLAAFQRYAVSGQAVADTATALGMSVDQVYQAKSRILKRLSEVIAQQVREEG